MAIDYKQGTPRELQQTRELIIYLHSLNLYESSEEVCLKQQIIGKLYSYVNVWVKFATLNEGLDRISASEQNANIYTYGSYRLGVHGPSSDVDILCVTSRYVLRDKHFFGNEPHCLEYILSQLSEVTKILPISNANLPLLKITMSGISLDLQHASLAFDNIKKDLVLTENIVLRGIDEKTAKSLNGCRVTDTLLSLVSNHKALIPSLKFIKEWARWRGVCSNVLGYFGGVNWAICLAYTCILYPRAPAARILHRFFYILQHFPWPQPLFLCHIQEFYLGFKVWDIWKHAEDVIKDRYCADCMPIITPTYPAINSTAKTSLATREVLLGEFAIGEAVCKRILSSESQRPTEWYRLLDPYPLFDSFKYFLSIELYAHNYQDLKAWGGFVSSKLSILVNEIQAFVRVRPWCKTYEDFTNDGDLKLIYFLGIAKRKQLVHSALMTYSLNQKEFKGLNFSSSVEHFKILIIRNAFKKRRVNIFIQKSKRHHLVSKKTTIIRKIYPDSRRKYLGILKKDYQTKKRKEIEEPERWIFSTTEFLI
jgi:poly(A) polymerase